MNSNIDDSIPWLITLVNKERDLQRYFELSMQKTLENEEDIEFIANILEEAEKNSILASILARLDDLISSELPGKLESLEAYEKKQPWLSEYLVCSDPEFYLLLQKHLSIRKLYDGPLDGVYGENTKKAVEKFKQEEGIDEPELGHETITKIISPQKELYFLLQEHLSSRQLYNGLVDGIYGEKTKQAVEKFKQEEGIDEPDLSPKTIDKILTS
jgi:hypothetical protein